MDNGNVDVGDQFVKATALKEAPFSKAVRRALDAALINKAACYLARCNERKDENQLVHK